MKLRLDLIFLLGETEEKNRLISKIISLHAGLEQCLNAIYDIRNKKHPNSFSKKISIVKNSQMIRALRDFNKARNLCAHKGTNFHAGKVKEVIRLCNKVIKCTELSSIDEFKEAEKRFQSRLDAAIYILMDLITKLHKVKIEDDIVLDGFYLPTQKTITDEINELIGTTIKSEN